MRCTLTHTQSTTHTTTHTAPTILPISHFNLTTTTPILLPLSKTQTPTALFLPLSQPHYHKPPPQPQPSFYPYHKPLTKFIIRWRAWLPSGPWQLLEKYGGHIFTSFITTMLLPCQLTSWILEGLLWWWLQKDSNWFEYK